MNVQLLIDSIVRQVTVLVAQLATAGGARAPLSHIAKQVFADLAGELAEQGVSRKVSADMFGMALRAYIRKVRRLNESSTVRGRSLWSAVLEVLNENAATRQQLIERFRHDDETLVRAVLHDLTESGLLFASGPSGNPLYRTVTDSELARAQADGSSEGLSELVWVIVYREGPLSREALAKRLRVDTARLDPVIDELRASGRLQQQVSADGEQLSAQDVTIRLDAKAGWEAAVFDHFQAVVQTIVQRLDARGRGAQAQDAVGGSTYTFDVWPGHPHAAEASESLSRFRREHSALRARIDAYNETHGRPAQYEQVVVYGGQCVRTAGASGEEDDNA